METDASAPQIPPELQARLTAAGVTYAASLAAALERDPKLYATYEKFLLEHRDEIAGAFMAALLAAFAATENDAQIVEFWNQVPREWEQPFLDVAQNVIAQADAQGQSENVAGLKKRLDTLRKMTREAENTPPVIGALLEFLNAPDDAAARVVFENRRALLQPYAAQRTLDEKFQSDNEDGKKRIAERSALLRELRGGAPRDLTPSPSPTRRGEHDPSPRPSPTRRGEHDPSPRPSPFGSGEQDAAILPSPFGRGVGGEGHTVDISGTANIHRDFVGGDEIIQGNELTAQTMTVNQVAAGGTAIVNNITEYHFEYEWKPPSPPYLPKVVPREFEVGEVLRRLEEQDTVAIGGRTAAVQGMAGIGKTTLAKILAHIVHRKPTFPQFKDGILWTDIGPEKKTRAQAQSILNEWAGYALRGRIEGMNFTPNAVRQLLERNPNLLVILDNVWSLDIVHPLRDALPQPARLLVTTRSRDVMRGLGGAVYELDKLSEADAYALVKLRLHWEPANDADKKWLEQLFKTLDFHALALDVALGLIARQAAPSLWRATAEKIIHSVQHGTEFDKLVMSADEREKNVERSLWFSYNALDETAQTRWRALGAFALGAPFETRFAARVWNCDDDTAQEQLTDFLNRALVSRGDTNLSRLRDVTGFEWQQHALLRGYALALLKHAGEWERVQARHAQVYADAMRAADDAQRYFELRGAYSQLKHAFEWAIVQDLDRAQDLISQCANLQAAFGNAFDNYEWCVRALDAANARGTRADIARAQVSLGNALSRVATLPGQNRRQRLDDALAAYDAALEYYRPDTAPLAYAATQNNRATILSALATLPGQDRRQRLDDALAAYDEALQYRRPDTAPLAYAMTQNNRGELLGTLATLPGEDRRQRLYDALAAYDEALKYRRPDTAPLDYAMTQGNLANRFEELASLPGEDRKKRLIESLRAAWQAFSGFQHAQHQQYAERAANNLRRIQKTCGEDFDALWKELGVGALPAWLAVNPLQEKFAALLNAYLEKQQTAAQSENDVALWQATVDAGEALFAEEFRELGDGVNWDALQEDLASAYNSLGNAHDKAGNKTDALAAYDRAIALQPDFAMWHRNRAGTLIELKRCDEARAAIDRARELEPEAARLADLEKAWGKHCA